MRSILRIGWIVVHDDVVIRQGGDACDLVAVDVQLYQQRAVRQGIYVCDLVVVHVDVADVR